MSDILKDYPTSQLILIGLVAAHELGSANWYMAILCRSELMRRKPQEKS